MTGNRASGRNPLRRKGASRRTKRIVHVLCEGKTEVEYLHMSSVQRLMRSCGEATIKYVSHRHIGRTDPVSLVKIMGEHLKREGGGHRGGLAKHDEMWIVSDVDSWTPKQLNTLIEWVRGDTRRRVAISNPKFELFLLLHFEEGRGCATGAAVDRRMQIYYPTYKKHILPTQFSEQEVHGAIKRSEKYFRLRDDGVPEPGTTGFHLLLQTLFGVHAQE